MEPSGWADAARNDKYHQGAEHQRAIDILESMFLARMSPSEAARAIAATYEEQIKGPDFDGVMGVFWVILCEAILVWGGTDGQTERLTDLIIEMQSLPDVTDDSGTPLKHTHGRVFWKDLPGWRSQFRIYTIDTVGSYDDPPGEWPWREQQAPLLNATTFAATLLDRAPFSTGMLFPACTALSCTTDVDEDDIEDHQQAELYMPAAATWILRAGRKLHEACEAQIDTGHTYALTPQRWDEWKRTFEAVSHDMRYEPESRSWAARAARELKILEVE